MRNRSSSLLGDNACLSPNGNDQDGERHILDDGTPKRPSIDYEKVMPGLQARFLEAEKRREESEKERRLATCQELDNEESPFEFSRRDSGATFESNQELSCSSSQRTSSTATTTGLLQETRTHNPQLTKLTSMSSHRAQVEWSTIDDPSPSLKSYNREFVSPTSLHRKWLPQAARACLKKVEEFFRKSSLFSGETATSCIRHVPSETSQRRISWPIGRPNNTPGARGLQEDQDSIHEEELKGHLGAEQQSSGCSVQILERCKAARWLRKNKRFEVKIKSGKDSGKTLQQRDYSINTDPNFF